MSNKKQFIIGKVRKQQQAVYMPFREAQHFFEPNSVWEVITILLPQKYPSGAMTLKRAGGLQDEEGREIFVKKSVQGDILKEMLREYGFKKGDVRKYMFLRVLSDGSLTVEAIHDDVGGYVWQGWGWRYVRNMQEEEDIKL